jgi:hypothetical protein
MNANENIRPNIVPEFIYHYTSLDSFEKIVTSKKIRASNILYLNDSQEMREAIEMMLRFLDNIDNDDSPQKILALIREIQKRLSSELFNDYIEGSVADLQKEIFVCSFSNKPDMLSQWRGYCPESQGICVCFGYTLEIQEFINSQGFSLVRCEYAKERETPKCLIDFINGIIAKYDSFSPHTKIASRIDAVLKGFELDFLQLASRVKNSAFVEEDEWRLVSGPLSPNDPNISYRPGKSMMVPYLEIKLCKEDNGSLNIPKVWIGPTPNKDLACHSIIHFLQKNKTFAYESQLCKLDPFPFDNDSNFKSKKIVETLVKNSDIPYRTW